MTDAQMIKRKLSLQQWTAIIAERNTSNLTVAEYCKQNNLSRNAYFYWLRQLRDEAIELSSVYKPIDDTFIDKNNRIVELIPAGNNSSAVPITIPEDKTPRSNENESIKISIGDINIHAYLDTSDELLSKVIRVIRNA